MGFGSLLEMNIDVVNGTLGQFVVENFDASELVLKLSFGPICINRQVVHDMLGIPIGNIDFFSIPLKPLMGEEGEESLLERWRSQFDDKTSIRPKSLASVILSSEDTGLLFKVNFLLLFVSTMMVSDTGGACTTSCQEEIIGRIDEDTEFQNIDWCGLLIHYLKMCKDSWPPKENVEYHFTGPMTFLQLLYLDSTLLEELQIARQRPAIKYLNSTYINERVTVELNTKGAFGKLPLQHAFSEPEVVEDFRLNIEALFNDILAKKIQLDSTLKRGLSMFADDVKLLEFNDQFHQLFKDDDVEDEEGEEPVDEEHKNVTEEPVDEEAEDEELSSTLRRLSMNQPDDAEDEELRRLSMNQRDDAEDEEGEELNNVGRRVSSRTKFKVDRYTPERVLKKRGRK